MTGPPSLAEAYYDVNSAWPSIKSARARIKSIGLSIVIETILLPTSTKPALQDSNQHLSPGLDENASVVVRQLMALSGTLPRLRLCQPMKDSGSV